MKTSEQYIADTASMFKSVPHMVIGNNIFSFLTALELFKLRGVSREWREIIRSSWSKIFKREMKE